MSSPVAASCDFLIAGFTSNPVVKPSPVEGRQYSNTLVGSVAYPSGGSGLTYSLVSGPSWLTVAPDGQLSGVPADADVGNNDFNVRAQDADGFSDEAILRIYVLGRYTGELGNSDFAAFSSQWLNTNCGLCGEADMDADGNVNMQDMEIFAGYWLK